MEKNNLKQIIFKNEGFFPFMKAFIAIIFALIMGGIILLLMGNNPIEAYSALVQGAFGSKRCFAETLLSTTPLIFGGLAFALAYRCGLFNMGVEGQIAMGGMAAAFLGYSITGLPPILHVPTVLIGAALTGAVWGIGPGFLKARFGVHEVISTIMLNYIAFKITGYMVSAKGPMKDLMDEMPASPRILNSAKITRIWKGTRLHWGIFLALILVVVVYYILFKTRLGYKIRAVGKNRFAAETVGISVPRHFVITMMLSGLLGGLAGGVEICGVHYRLLAAFSPGYGFDSIAVALLGMLHPFGIIFSAFLFGILRSGAILMQAVAGVSKDMVQVISAIIIFFMGMSGPLGKIFTEKFTKEKGGNVRKNI
ncbi:MAG TPA: ABC transporter permease [Candidatus Atribacteria bacterium]|jgi:simple sugar transport system permease protein|nr:ABC transporter permease [Candidatus Atribacteria bacterium]